jgi:hypothetical protein
MCKVHRGKESDSSIRFNDGMFPTVTVTTHAPDGRIVRCVTLNGFDDPQKYEGTLPSQWIDPHDHAKVQHAIAVAAKGGTPKPCLYLLNAALYDGRGWQVETYWRYNPSVDTPVIGLSRTLMVLPKLTKNERALFKELSEEGENCNVRDNASESIARRSAKSRLARKLKISTRQLAAFCAAYRDII